MPSNANIYESFFSTHSSLSTSNQQREADNTNSSESESAPKHDYTMNNMPSQVITTMVAALLKAQQYMIDSCKDGSTSVVLLAASFLYVENMLCN